MSTINRDGLGDAAISAARYWFDKQWRDDAQDFALDGLLKYIATSEGWKNSEIVGGCMGGR